MPHPSPKEGEGLLVWRRVLVGGMLALCGRVCFDFAQDDKGARPVGGRA